MILTSSKSQFFEGSFQSEHLIEKLEQLLRLGSCPDFYSAKVHQVLAVDKGHFQTLDGHAAVSAVGMGCFLGDCQ